MACKNYKNKFEQGMINEFTVEAVDLGDLQKIRIGHDNAGKLRDAAKTSCCLSSRLTLSP